MSFLKYQTYKDSGVEWLGEVPEHWDVSLQVIQTRPHPLAPSPNFGRRGTRVEAFKVPLPVLGEGFRVRAAVAKHQTQLPDKTLLQAKLHEFYALNVATGEDL